MQGLLLDPRTGKPERTPQVLSERGVPITLEENYERGWRGGRVTGSDVPDLSTLERDQQDMLAMRFGDDGPFGRGEESIYRELQRLPAHIKANLDAGKAYRARGIQPPMADHSNYEVLRYWITAATSLTAAAEAIMVPAFNFGTSELNVGSSLKMTMLGSHSINATPGTFIYRMRWGGVAGALQATGPTITPSNSATVTTQSWLLEYWMTVRSIGATGTLWCQGRLEDAGFLLATSTGTQIVTYLTSQMHIPSQAAAVGANTDLTAAAGPSPTYQPSASTATLATNIALLECMN